MLKTRLKSIVCTILDIQKYKVSSIDSLRFRLSPLGNEESIEYFISWSEVVRSYWKTNYLADKFLGKSKN